MNTTTDPVSREPNKPCQCWAADPPLPHEGHCCMTDEGIETKCHDKAGKAAYHRGETIRAATKETQ